LIVKFEKYAGVLDDFYFTENILLGFVKNMKICFFKTVSRCTALHLLL